MTKTAKAVPLMLDHLANSCLPVSPDDVDFVITPNGDYQFMDGELVRVPAPGGKSVPARDMHPATISAEAFAQMLLAKLDEETLELINGIKDGDYLRGNVNASVMARDAIRELAEAYGFEIPEETDFGILQDIE